MTNHKHLFKSTSYKNVRLTSHFLAISCTLLCILPHLCICPLLHLPSFEHLISLPFTLAFLFPLSSTLSFSFSFVVPNRAHSSFLSPNLLLPPSSSLRNDEFDQKLSHFFFYDHLSLNHLKVTLKKFQSSFRLSPLSPGLLLQ